MSFLTYLAETQHLAVSEDGYLYQSIPLDPDGEEFDWKRIGRIDDDYCVESTHLEELTYLQSEWEDFQRRAGETEHAGWVAWNSSRGTF